MSASLVELLHESHRAAAAGDTRKSWELINTYARCFWLNSEADIPTELRGDFYSVRAAAADWLGLEDEAVAALTSMERWAKEHDNHGAALVAGAHLAYQALNQTEFAVFLLSRADKMLAELAQRFSQWRPHADSPTIAEDDSLTWKTVDKRHAVTLATAAATAHTVAINIAGAGRPEHAGKGAPEDQGSIDATGLVEFFAGMVQRFGKNPASPMDELLWYAQDHWACGRKDAAIATAQQVLSQATQPAPRYEAHFMLGHFAMLEILDTVEGAAEYAAAADTAGNVEELTAPALAPTAQLWTQPHDNRELEEQVATHWGECAELALAMGAPSMALERAELACRMLSSLEREDDAWSLASRMTRATNGVPMCPALLNITAVLAQAALATGRFQDAWDNARTAGEWSDLTPDIERTAACYSIATIAGLELGLQQAVVRIQHRRVELYVRSGDLLHASQILQSIAVASGHDSDAAQELMTRAWDLLEQEVLQSDPDVDTDDVAWNRGHWQLTMATLAATEEDMVDHAQRAAAEFRQADCPDKEASAWLTVACGRIDLGQPELADEAIRRATEALPELDAWLFEDVDELDPAVSELVEHYRFVLGLRRQD